MPKLKTHKGAAKRFRKTGSGRIVRMRNGKSHILEKKSPKRKMNLGKSALVSEADEKRINKMI